jgi:hypothetical protein
MASLSSLKKIFMPHNRGADPRALDEVSAAILGGLAAENGKLTGASCLASCEVPG